MTPFEVTTEPILDGMVNSFGDRHDPNMIRDLTRLVLGINLCGEGVDPNDTARLLEHISHTVESLNRTLEPISDDPQPDIDDEFVELIDRYTADRLLGDEELICALSGAFRYVWPEGRDTVLGLS